jgi:hypothetical protein
MNGWNDSKDYLPCFYKVNLSWEFVLDFSLIGFEWSKGNLYISGLLIWDYLSP